MTRAAVVVPTTGKSARQENFPVASLLLHAAVRPRVMAFYRFARTADDVADDPALDAGEKLDRLNRLEECLRGHQPADALTAPAVALRAAVDGDEGLLDHAAQLLTAFRRDAVADHCRDWPDLMDYCRHSAAPVGRFLLDLHGEDGRGAEASDALCAALQVLNHAQDCRTDFIALGRVYLPGDWLLAEGLNEQCLAAPRCSTPLRRVLDRVLDGTASLLEAARPLPRLIGDRRLRMQAGVTVEVAFRLLAELRGRDPLAAQVRLGPWSYARAVAFGVTRGFGAAA